LVGPPATAALVTRTVPQMFVVSGVLAAFTVWLGLVLSYHLGTAGAATIALVAIAAFFLTLAVKPLARGLRPAQAPKEATA
ncbi:MAG TPA: metal ABC transporter permease, partial [Propionibacterium sp.]|nr:metal ABC transporter permease [Propionibacterium sp.]